MKPNEILQDMQAKVSDLLRQSPAKDIERNVKSLLNQGFNRLDLVTREEFDVQAQVLARTREKLEALEKRVAELESLRGEGGLRLLWSVLARRQGGGQRLARPGLCLCSRRVPPPRTFAEIAPRRSESS